MAQSREDLLKIAPNAVRKRLVALFWIFVAVIVVFGGGSLATLFSFRAEQDARNQVVQTQAVLGSLSDLLNGAIDAETSVRGFLLTGEGKYLQYYERGTQRIPDAIAVLRRTLEPVATPVLREKLDRLQEAYEKKLGTLHTKLSLAQNGRRAEAIALVGTDEGRVLMEEVRRLTAEVESNEEAVLVAALAHARNTEDRSVYALIGLGGVVIAILGLALWLAIRSMNDELALHAAKADREAHEQATLLSRELNHRVKNLFAVILSIVSMSSRGATDVGSATTRIRERIMALSRAHEVTQGKNVGESAELKHLVELVLSPFTSGNGSSARIEGPEVTMPVNMVTPLGLIFHEWATNAAKYGALSRPQGTVDIRWTVEDAGTDRHLLLNWSENGGPEVTGPPDQEGFGSMLIRASAEHQIGGTLDLDWAPDGMKARLVVPLDAPGGTG
ncbi:MAG: CHASE3 domain-containing protein [Rhodospirillaceae bacterium]